MLRITQEKEIDGAVLSESKPGILKVKPPPEYPPEEGHYLRGNDYSPVAVVVMHNAPREEGKETPPEIEQLVRVAIENGAALAGTLQTANIGLEKLVANIVADTNIRYLILCGREVEGHKAGGALIALIKNDVDAKRIIIGTSAPTAYLFNIPLRVIERFRKQITLINLLNVIDLETVKKAVRSCYQEEPTKFMEHMLYDVGAYQEPAIVCKITWRIAKPESIEEWEIDQDFIKKLEG